MVEEDFKFSEEAKKDIKTHYECYYAQFQHGVIVSYSFYKILLNNFGKEWCDKYIVHDELVPATSSIGIEQNQGWWNKFRK